MRTKTSLLAGAAVGVALASGLGAQADAKTAHHAARRAEAAARSKRLNDAEAAQRQVQAQAAQAQASAQQAQAQLASEIQTLPSEVHAQVAQAVPKPRPSWADNTSVSGRMYFDLTHLERKEDGTKIAPSGAGFDIKRFYVGIDHRFNDTWSGNVTTDVQYNSAESLTQVYIKKAYLQAKVSDALIIRAGSADLPWIPFVEDAYGYRFVENVLPDRTRFGTSADWGLHATGKLAGGLVGYAVSVVDGAGYKNPVRSKTMDIEGRANLNLDHFVLALGGYTGKLGKDVQGGPPTFHTATRWDALAAYVDARYRLGVEYSAADNWNTVATAAGDKSDGYSLWGSINLTPQVSAFARWDHVKPSKTLKPSERDNYYNLGLNWEPAKIVDLALVYKRDKVDNGLFSTSNGTIGGVLQGTYDEVGLFGQFRW